MYFVPETQHRVVLNKLQKKVTPLVSVGVVRDISKRQNIISEDDMESKVDPESNVIPQMTARVYISSSNAKYMDTDKGSTDGRGTDVVKPTCMYPWEPLLYVLDLRMLPYYVPLAVQFAAMFTSLTLLPLHLTAAPYHLNTSTVGITYLPVGVSMLIGAVCGGILSDMSGKKYSNAPDGCLVYPISLSYLNAVGCIGFGYSLYYKVDISGILVSHCILGFGQSVFMPSIMGYLSTYKSQNAAAANSVGMFLCFSFAAIAISFGVPLSMLIGIQYLFWIFFGLSILSCIWATWNCYFYAICN